MGSAIRRRGEGRSSAEHLARHRESECRRPRPLLQRSEEHTSELQSRLHLVCRLLLEKKKAQFRDTLPIAAEDGSLSTRFTGTFAADHVEAKTGQLGEVNSLSGYGRTRHGHNVAFSII